MSKTLLTIALMGSLLFSCSGCAVSPLIRSPEPITAPTIMTVPTIQKSVNYIGMKLSDVLKILGEPTGLSSCRINLPVPSEKFENRRTIMGNETTFEGYADIDGEYTYAVIELCSLYGTVVGASRLLEEQGDENASTNSTRYLDYNLVRKLLAEGPRCGPGLGAGYVLRPGEMEL